MLARITVFKIIAKTIITASVLLLLLWLGGLYDFYQQIPVIPNTSEEKTDAIIVLTGGEDRIAEGVRLLNHGYASKMLVSGVAKSTAKEELLESQNLPASEAKQTDLSKIAVGYEAVNTIGNARETADWVAANNIKSIRLVTSSYHMPRALLEFNQRMPGLTIIPHPVIPAGFNRDNWRYDGFTRNLILIEYTKYLLAKVGK